MSLPKQTASFAFGRVRQETDPKHLQIGELTEAINVKRTKDKSYQKRPGYSRTVPTFTGASFTGPPESLLPGDGTSLLMRDNVGRAWAYDADANTYRGRGSLPRVFPRYEIVSPVNGGSPKPIAVEAGNNTFFFSVGPQDSGVNQSLFVTILDTTTGIVILKNTETSSLGAVANIPLTAAYDGTNVWVFTSLPSTPNVVISILVSIAGAATIATYQTLAVGATIWQLSARRLTSIGEVAVVAASMVGGGDAVTSHSYLNTATGVAKAAPAPVTTTTSTIGQVYVNTGLSILVSDGSGNAWYYSRWRFTGGGAGSATLFLTQVNATTLAITSDTSLTTRADTVATRGFGVSSGYVAANGDRVVYAQYDNGATTPTRIDQILTTRYTYNGTTTATLSVARNSWLASIPAVIGTSWYFLTGFEDIAQFGAIGALQRTFHLRDSDGNILAQIAYGGGASAYHAGMAFDLAGATDSFQAKAHVPPMFASATKLIAAIAIESSALSADVARLEINTAESFAPSIMSSLQGLAAGGIPVVWSKASQIHEMGPLLFPPYIRRTAGAAATETVIAAVYHIEDANGDLWRSSPVTLVGTFGAGDTINVPTLRHTLTETVVQIEIYAGTSSPKLQGVIDNDQTTNELSFVLPTPIITTSEILYTQGGALSNSPTPPARAAASWRERIFLAQGDIVFYSQEIRAGFAPQFNEILSFNWTDGTGDILAIGVVNWNYLALFKRDAIGVISGPGPDGRGQGNYTVQTLPTKLGCTNLGSLVSGPGGCYFQDSNTGRICAVLPSLEVVEVAGGADNYSSNTITAAAHIESARLVEFYSDGVLGNFIIVLDYRHPTEGAPAGQVYVWQSTGLLPGYGATVDNTGPVHIETSGILRRPQATFVDATSGTAAKVLASVTTGDMAPMGLQGEFSLNWVTFLGTYLGQAHGGIQITMTPNFTGTPIVTGRSDSASDQIATRPPGCARIQAIKCKVEEVDSGSPAGGTPAFDFEGIVLTYQSRNRAQTLNADHVV